MHDGQTDMPQNVFNVLQSRHLVGVVRLKPNVGKDSPVSHRKEIEQNHCHKEGWQAVKHEEDKGNELIGYRPCFTADQIPRGKEIK